MTELKAMDRLPPKITNLKMTIQVHGVFAFPDEWRQTDEDNKNTFHYSVAFLESKLIGGRVLPREMTEKERKDIEEAENAKKAKKAPKKDSKIEPPKPSPEEEKLRLQREQAEHDEQQRIQQEWDALTEEEQYYRTFEDPFKNASIKFEQTHMPVELTGQGLVIQLERFRVDKGEWLFFYKSPSVNEDEVAKLRKSKPKTLNINDLNTIVFRAWLDYSEFETMGNVESLQRIQFTQYVDETAPAETPKPNVEKMYMLVKVNLSQPFNAVKQEPYPCFQDIIPMAPQPLPVPMNQQCIQELRADLQLIIESLAMEHSNMFSKELNQYQENKVSSVLTTHRKQDLQRRKEHFLYDFNISGKYKILKERIKKSIVRLCRDKFEKSGSVTGISTTQSDQFYSELYVFLMDEMRSVLANLVKEHKEALKEDFAQLLSKKLGITDIGNSSAIEQNTGESRVDKLERLCQEYETLNKYDEVEKQFTQLLALDKKSGNGMIRFAQFCLRTDRITQAEQLVEQALAIEGNNLNNQLLLAALYYKREKIKESRFILELLLEKDKNNLVFSLFLFFILQQSDPTLSRKMYYISERIKLRALGLIPQEGMHKQEPQLYDIPWIKIPVAVPDKPEKDKAILEQREKERQQFEQSHYQPQLNEEQVDDMYLELLNYFEEQNLLDLADRCIKLLNNKQHPKTQLLQAKIAEYKSEFHICIQALETLLQENPDDWNIRLMLVRVLYKSLAHTECEKQICQLLQNPSLQEDQYTYFSMYLLLGNIYISNKKYGNARAVFNKGCQIKSNSSLAWMGLGIACHECGKYAEAEDALRMANLYEPTNDTVWGYLSLNCLKDGGRFRDANAALREMKKTDIQQVVLLARLSKEFYNIAQYQTAKELLQHVLALAELQDVLSNDIVQYQIQLAETNEMLGQTEQAIELFQDALIRIEDEQVEKQVKISIERLQFQQLIKY